MTDSKTRRTALGAVLGTALTVAMSTMAFTPVFAAEAPTVTWSIADGTTYVYGEVPAAVPTCTATTDDLLVASITCDVDPSTYVTTVGTHVLSATVTETMTDATVTQIPATLTYTVAAWDLKGFYRPVKMGDGVWNTKKAGSTVPFKFKVYAGDSKLKGESIVASFTAQQIDCTSLAAIGNPLPVASAHKVLRYSEGAFHQNWKTPKLIKAVPPVKGKKVATTACYAVTMTTLDGSALTASFLLK